MLKRIQRWFVPDRANSTDTYQPARSDKQKSATQSAVAVTIDELISLKSAIRGISLMSARVKNSSITGAHPSRFRGRGMDYQESRAYQPGDDVRSMDWRVTARAGHPYVKMYEEERERPVMLLVDLNPGMFFATQGAFKSVLAARISALIAWTSVANGDRIGALIFNGKHQELQPRGGSKSALQLFRLLIQATDPEQGMQSSMDHSDGTESTGLHNALKRCRRVAKPGSLIFIFSDFYHVNEGIKAQLLRLRQHNDVVAMQIVDPLEQSPPPADLYGVSDGEHNGLLDTRNNGQLASYTRWCNDHHADVAQTMRKTAIPLLQISTTDDAASTLRRFMASSMSTKANTASSAVTEKLAV